jgi:hypothetical protein
MTKHVLRPCLYCDVPGRSKEHVLPQMFGVYEKNLTVWDVCAECNKIHFGQKLETKFGRNSAEAIFRLIFGLKSPAKAKEIGGDRVTAIYLEDDEFRGAELVFEPDDNGSFQARMPPQVIIKHGSLEVPRAFREDQITAEALRPYLRGSEVIIPGEVNSDEVLRLRAKMEQAGFEFISVEQFAVASRTAPDFLLRIDAVVDDAISRLVTKIAVNFLAFTAGYDFAMQPEFRPMRRYARYGDPCLRDHVRSAPVSIVVDAFQPQYGNGHLITMDWPLTRSAGILAQVCFFNRISHQVSLADDVDAVWRNIRVAYFFNPESHTAERINLAPGDHMHLLPAAPVGC